MIIISKFHDYYDGVSKMGIDTELRYIRTKKLLEDHRHEYNWYYKRDCSLCHKIGFCGKIYTCYEYHGKFIYSFKEYEEYIEKLTALQKDEIKWIIEDSTLFEEYKCPIFINRDYNRIDPPRHGREFELNCRLEDYQFYRIFDAYRAYQEIRMWLSNQAAPEKPIPHIPDIIMRDAKGFDKYSFRKDKQK